ncbi:MAG: saccharopine dehydrogenase C-terminal domain-containing protein [bacterium]
MDQQKVIVLGAGLVGSPIAADLARDKDLKVAVADISKENLSRIKPDNIHRIQVNLSRDKELRSLVADYDLVVNAVPGFMGFQTLKECIMMSKDVVDIAFYAEDVLSLSELAREKGVRVIADMGVAPGMSNLLVGYASSRLEKTENVEIYVGGLPKVRQKPWEYRAVFSPTDVIEEYTRPARLVEQGKIVTKPALTEVEQMNFEGIGTLEAFNSDGLRSLMFTVDAENMKEKTLRYPGYAEKVRLLADSGFFNLEKKEVEGQVITPLDFTSAILFDQWKLGEDEVDLTIMRVVVEGRSEGRQVRYTYDLYDERDLQTGVHSMARTTGYAATMATRLLLQGHYKQKGITVPEMIGSHHDLVMFMLSGLKDRNIVYREDIRTF